jgi:hypothetical protein
MVVLPVPISPWINTGGNAVCIPRSAARIHCNAFPTLPMCEVPLVMARALRAKQSSRADEHRREAEVSFFFGAN